ARSRAEPPREESRARFEDLVGPAELGVLPLERGDPPLLLRRHAGSAAAVDLGLADPLAKRLRADVELPGDPADMSLALPARVDGGEHQGDRAFLHLTRVPLG